MYLFEQNVATLNMKGDIVLSEFKYPIQMLSNDLNIVGSNGVAYDMPSQIKEVCDKLNNGDLSYVDVYDSGPVEKGYVNPIITKQQITNIDEFKVTIERRMGITDNIAQSNLNETYDQLPAATSPHNALQADVVYPESKIIPIDEYTTSNIPANALYGHTPVFQVYAPIAQPNIIATENLNVTSIAPTKELETSLEKKPYNAAIEAQTFLKRVKIVNGNNGIYMYMGSYYKLLDKNELQKIIYKVLQCDIDAKGTYSYIDDIHKFVVASAASVNFERSNSENKVMFSNYILNLDTLQAAQHSPLNYNTHALSIPFVSFQNLNAPVFSKYVYDLAGGNQILIQRIWEALGLLLSNDIKAKKIVVLVGNGNTGKSVFGNVVRELIADGNVTSFAPQRLTERFIGASLVNSAVNICMDLPSVPIDPATAAILKNLSGGDIVNGEIKYMNNFSYIYQGHLLFGSNYPIRLNYKDQAFAERLLIIPCENPIPKHLQDTNLLEKIKTELPVIASYAVKCFASVRKNHYTFSGDDVYSVNDDDIYVKATLKTEFENYANYSVEFFSKQMCELTSYDKFVEITELFNEYQKFCRTNNIDAIKNSNTFSRKLHKILPSIKNNKNRLGNKTQNLWCGIALKK